MKGPQGTGQQRTIRGRVSGRVQGVGFRWFVLQAARRSGLRGRVRNLADGSVEFIAQGDDGDVEHWLETVREGPPGSRVDEIETAEVASRARYEEFMID